MLAACAALAADPPPVSDTSGVLAALARHGGAELPQNASVLAQLAGALLSALLGPAHAAALARVLTFVAGLSAAEVEPAACEPALRALRQLTKLLLRLPVEAEPSAPQPPPELRQPRDVLGIARAAPLSRNTSWCDVRASSTSPLPGRPRLDEPSRGAGAAALPPRMTQRSPSPLNAELVRDDSREGFFEASDEAPEGAAAAGEAAAGAERAHAALMASCGVALKQSGSAAGSRGATLQLPAAGGALSGSAASLHGSGTSGLSDLAGGAETGAGAQEGPALTIGHVHAVLEVRAVLQQLLGALGALARTSKPRADGDGADAASWPADATPGASARDESAHALQRALADLVQTSSGFFDNDGYAAARVHALGSQRELLVLLTKLHLALALSPRRARPEGLEARRRLKTFVNSLWMEMPHAPSIAAMQSWSVVTPVYTEAILYSERELLLPLSDGRSLLDVLKSLYAAEWANFLERIGVHVSTDPHEYHIHWADAQLARQVRLWASMRGQTLTRTMVGMIQYERALALISRVERPPEESSAAEAGATIGAKFSVVIAAQLYAQFRASGDPRADDINWLLLRFPTLRIAFVAPWPPPEEALAGAAGSADGSGAARVRSRPSVPPVLFATLARCDPDTGALVADAEVALPGNPFLGEGKPENQNLALPFAFGEKVQVIDMNQEGYLEEALKMRSLLREFDLAPPGQPPRTIVGFTEHIFTEVRSRSTRPALPPARLLTRLPSTSPAPCARSRFQASGFVTAVYMALQEKYFCAFHQRVADVPLDVRMHYGHPDVLDKLHFLSRGGISRPSKQINLNEDIFAAYSTMLRGGSVIFREYLSVGKGRMTNLSEIFYFEVKLAQGAAEQCLSRDVYRLTRALRLTRLMSFYYSGLGFYIHQVLVMRTAMLIGYLLALLTLLKLDKAVMPAESNIGFMATMPLIVTVATVVPAATMILAQRGVRSALSYVFMIATTLAPVYYIFITQARAHFFAHTIRYGGAKYFVCNRAVSTTHVSLHELFAAYARSHFYPACDLAIALAVGRAHTSDLVSYNGTTWMLGFISVCWLCAPFLYNLQAVELPVVLADARALARWLRTPAQPELTGGRPARPDESWEAWWVQTYHSPTQAGWEAPAFSSLAGLYYVFIALKLFGASSIGAGVVSLVAALAVAAMAPWLAMFSPGSARGQRRCVPVALCTLLVCLACLGAVAFVGTLGDVARALAILYFSLAALACALEVLLVETSPLILPLLRLLHRARDLLLSGLLLAPLLALGALWLPGELHKMLLFQANFAKPSLSCTVSYYVALAIVVVIVVHNRMVYLDFAAQRSMAGIAPTPAPDA